MFNAAAPAEVSCRGGIFLWLGVIFSVIIKNYRYFRIIPGVKGMADETRIVSKRLCRRAGLAAALFFILTLFAPNQAFSSAPRYGAVNEAIPHRLMEWKSRLFAASGADYSYLPIYGPGHGSAIPGQVGLVASNEELEDYLNGLQKHSGGTMKWKYIYQYAAADSNGAPEVPRRLIRLPFAVFSKEGVFEPEDVMALGRPVVWLQGQIHGDEASGGESMQVTAWRLTRGDLRYILDRVVVLMLPRANPEGARRWERGTNSAIVNGGAAELDPNRDNIWFSSLLQRAVHKTMNAYAPHLVLDQHEMFHTSAAEYAWTLSGDRRIGAATGNRADRTFDIAILNAPHPAVSRKITAFALNVVERELRARLDEKNIRWSVYESRGAEWGEPKRVAGMVMNGGRMVPGYRELFGWLLEADGDPRMVDPSYALKGAVSLLTEAPSAKPRTLMESRTRAQNAAAEALLLTAYRRHDELLAAVEGGRRERTEAGRDGGGSLTLGYSLAPGYSDPAKCTESINEHWLTLSRDHEGRSEAAEIASEVKVGRMAWDAYTDGPNRGRKRFGYVPESVIKYPYAYIFEARPAMLDRLACTGVRLHRLTRDVSLDVTALRVRTVRRGGDYSELLCDEGSQPFRFSVSGDVYEKRGAKFRRGAYVLYMAQPAAPFGALALDPQSCWNYANAAAVITGRGAAEQLLKAEAGADFPVYRLTKAVSLPSEPLPDLAKFVGAETARPVPIDEESGFLQKAEAALGAPAALPADLYLPEDGISGSIPANGKYNITMDDLRRLCRAMGGDGRTASKVRWALLAADGSVRLLTPDENEGLTVDTEKEALRDADGRIFLRMTAQTAPAPQRRMPGAAGGSAALAIAALAVLAVWKFRAARKRE